MEQNNDYSDADAFFEKLSEDFRRMSVTDTHPEVPEASGSWRTCRVGEQQFVATAVISLAVLGHICFDGTSATTNPWSSAGVCQLSSEHESEAFS